MNTLQGTYLTARWHHNFVTFNVAEVYLDISLHRVKY